MIKSKPKNTTTELIFILYMYATGYNRFDLKFMLAWNLANLAEVSWLVVSAWQRKEGDIQK